MSLRTEAVARLGNRREAGGDQNLARFVRERHSDHLDALRVADLRQEQAQIIGRTKHGDADVWPFAGPVPRGSDRRPIGVALDDPDRHPHRQFAEAVTELPFEHDRDAAAHPCAAASSVRDAVVVARRPKRRRTCNRTLSASANTQSFTPRRTICIGARLRLKYTLMRRPLLRTPASPAARRAKAI